MKIALETKLRHMEKQDRKAIHRMFENARRENGGPLWFRAGVSSAEQYFRAKRVLASIGLALLVILIAAIVHGEPAHADQLKASWYSEASLKKEGTWKTSKGVMANGKRFDETKNTCATRLYPLGRTVYVRNKKTGGTVACIVTDRIGRRFAKTRIDLSKAAFKKIASLKEGLVDVEVSEVRHE